MQIKDSRNELAEGYVGADENYYRVFRTGPFDQSPLHITYPSGYNSDCSHCWLNASHSVQAHAANLEVTRSRLRSKTAYLFDWLQSGGFSPNQSKLREALE